MIKLKKSLSAVVILIALLISFSSFSSHFELAKHLEIFISVFKKLNQEYVDEIDSGELMREGIDAMLNSLDPYTVYYSESEIEDYKASISGEYGGIGSMIRTDSDYVIITEPYEDSPAAMAGLKAGDKILSVDGKSTKGKSAGDLSKLLKGTPGTDVVVQIERPYEGEQTLTIKRSKIKLKSVPHYDMVGDGYAYIKLNRFTTACSKEVINAYRDLEKENDIKAVILDLRGNPGGLLREAINVSNVFVKKGQLITYTQGREEDSRKVYNTLNNAVNDSCKLVVLINGNSASASEIVSGTMQDLDRGLVLGQRSYGKGLVQTTKPIAYNSQIKLTTAKYYIPSGRCIQELDYSQKDEKGKAIKMADSARTEFKTVSGRIVSDGSGIHPDLQAKDSSFAIISRTLSRKNLIFDFVTKFVSEHDSIAPAKDFKVTDNDFKNFKTFIANKDYSYKTETERKLEEFETKTKKESYYNALAVELNQLHEKLSADKEKDLDKYQKEIKHLIRREILTRYYFQRGKIIASFERDNYLTSAIQLLNDTASYEALFKVEKVGNE